MFRNFCSNDYPEELATYTMYKLAEHDYNREASGFAPIDWETYE